MHVIVVLRIQEREKTGKIFEKIITKIFPNIMKTINPKNQEA